MNVIIRDTRACWWVFCRCLNRRWLASLALMAFASALLAAEPSSSPGAEDLRKADQIVGTNRAEALQLYQRAAEAGHAEAMSALGYYLLQDGRNEEAAGWYRKASEAGNLGAMAVYGALLREGKGVGKNDVEAARWWRKAAESGDSGAMLNLGWAYQNGVGVTRDASAALDWYRRAAAAGEPLAMFNLGNAFENGQLGLQINMTEAVTWYRKAAAAGDDNAKKRLIALGL